MKKTTNASEKALNIIKEKNIKPIPEWEFKIKNIGIWVGFGLSFGVMILSVGVVWFGWMENVIEPIMWLILATLFLGLTLLVFGRTKKSYRYIKWKIGLLLLILAICVGGVVFKLGWANTLDKKLGINYQAYRTLVPIKIQVWNNPSNGYLSGKVIKILDNNNILIEAFDKKTWTVEIGKAFIRGRVDIKADESIKIIGTQTGKGNFMAEEIRPWIGSGKN